MDFVYYLWKKKVSDKRRRRQSFSTQFFLLCSEKDKKSFSFLFIVEELEHKMMLKLSFLLLAITHIVVSSIIINETKHPNVVLLHVNNLVCTSKIYLFLDTLNGYRAAYKKIVFFKSWPARKSMCQNLLDIFCSYKKKLAG